MASVKSTEHGYEVRASLRMRYGTSSMINPFSIIQDPYFTSALHSYGICSLIGWLTPTYSISYAENKKALGLIQLFQPNTDEMHGLNYWPFLADNVIHPERLLAILFLEQMYNDEQANS